MQKPPFKKGRFLFCIVSKKGLALLIALLEILAENKRRRTDVLFEALVKVGERGKSALLCDFIDGEVEVALQKFAGAEYATPLYIVIERYPRFFLKDGREFRFLAVCNAAQILYRDVFF